LGRVPAGRRTPPSEQQCVSGSIPERSTTSFKAHQPKDQHSSMTRRAQICPACHRPFPPKLIVLGPVRQRIVDLIAANRPDGTTRGEILATVEAAPE